MKNKYLHLCLECVVLLAEVLLPVVLGVAPPVAPLEGLVGRHVDVLQVVVAGIAAVRSRAGDWQGPWASGAILGPPVPNISGCSHIGSLNCQLLANMSRNPASPPEGLRV